MIRDLVHRIPQDKRDHALVGLALFTLLAPFSPWLAFLFVFVVAAVWELYQFGTGRGVADLKDILATCLIPGIGVLLWAFF